MTTTGPILHFDPNNLTGQFIDLERLVASRLLIQGSSGAGKSFLLRYILEQLYGRIQQFIFDPEGEFTTLRELFDYVVVSAGSDGDIRAHPDTADRLCRQLVDLQASAIFDLNELDPDDRQEFVGNFLNRLVNLPKTSWRSALVVVDEAHEFAPEDGQPPSRKPMELVVSKGRKRGLCAIYSTQRLSKLSKNASDLQNILVGYTGLDVDVKRASDILGFRKSRQQELRELEREFFAFGPAFGKEVLRVQSGDVRTHHPKPGEVLAPTPPPRGALADLIRELAAIPADEAQDGHAADAPQAAPHVGGITLRQVEERVAAAVRETETRFAGLAEAAVADLRASVRPHVEALYHALANGSASGGEDRKAPRVDGGGGTTLPSPEGFVNTRRQPAAVQSSTLIDAGFAPRHQKVLDALARLEWMGIEAPSRTVLAAVAKTSPTSSGYEKTLGNLSGLELVTYPSGGAVALTAAGRKLAAAPAPVTLQELHEGWFRIFPPQHVRILKVLIEWHPSALTREDLAARSNNSPTSSGYEKALGRLNSFGVACYPRPGFVAATPLLFPAALTR